MIRKRTIGLFLIAALGTVQLFTGVFAESFDFESPAEYAALNNGNMCEREIVDTLSVSGAKSYKCSGSGAIGFKILGALEPSTVNDDEHFYVLTAKLYAETEGAVVNAKITTPGGYAKTQKSFNLVQGDWTDIELKFIPQKNSVFDTIVFESADEENQNSIFYVDDVQVFASGTKQSVRLAYATYFGAESTWDSDNDDIRITRSNTTYDKGWSYQGAPNLSGAKDGNVLLMNVPNINTIPIDEIGVNVESKNYLSFTEDDYGKIITLEFNVAASNLTSARTIPIYIYAKDIEGNVIEKVEASVEGTTVNSINGGHIMKTIDYTFTVNEETEKICKIDIMLDISEIKNIATGNSFRALFDYFEIKEIVEAL